MNSEVDEPQAGTRTYRLGELGTLVGGTVDGDNELAIHGVNDLGSAREGEISFVTADRYLDQLKRSSASAVVAGIGLKVDRPAIIVDRPELALAKLLVLFAPPLPTPIGIHPTAVVDGMLSEHVAVGPNAVIGPRTRIGKNTVIHANVTIGPDTTIGSDCLVWPGVVIRERVTIADRVIIHPNATIGSDGFGYNLLNGRHEKIRHIGTVVIEDDVELGAGACVDRAKAGATVIGSGTKVDNLVQIGHNVKIGRNVILVGQVGISGSVTLGDYVVLAGKVGVRDHVNIGDKAQAAACCLVSKDVPSGLTVNGIPAIDNRDYLRQQVQVRRLPRLAEKLANLVRRINELEQTVHDLKRSGT